MPLVSARNLQRGQRVLVKMTAPKITAPAAENRSSAIAAILVRPYPGGKYDHGDLWIIADTNGREHVAPASESLMTAVV